MSAGSIQSISRKGRPRRSAGVARFQAVAAVTDFMMDLPLHAETLIVTDAAINIAPTLEDKVHIIQNAIDLGHALRFVVAVINAGSSSLKYSLYSAVPEGLALVTPGAREPFHVAEVRRQGRWGKSHR